MLLTCTITCQDVNRPINTLTYVKGPGFVVDDLLWVCRHDRGMRPRTALTLWQALVRPIMEYASEIWCGQVPAYLIEDAETLQLNFLRGTLGLHSKGGGVSNDAIRAETGCESLADRWSKLQLGYYRRLFAADPDRLLRVVAVFRHAERVASGGVGFGSRGWMRVAEASLTELGLRRFWASQRQRPT